MTPLNPAAVRLLDESAEVRREAVDAVDATTLAGRYALRQALLGDEDAEVRASAARRLGEARERLFAPALIEALRDPLPMVRDRVWRALARMGTRNCSPRRNASFVRSQSGGYAGPPSGPQPLSRAPMRSNCFCERWRIPSGESAARPCRRWSGSERPTQRFVTECMQ